MIARSTKLFNKAKIIAIEKGLNWRNDLFIDTKETRSIQLKSDGTTLAFQDWDTWEVQCSASSRTRSRWS